MWLTLMMRNWQLVVIGLLICALGASTLHSRALKAERDEKIAVIDSMRREAETYRATSQRVAKETSDGFSKLVEQIRTKDTALNAARARFGSCNVARGITAHGMLMPAGAGQADVPESTGGTQEPERISVDAAFINDCAADAAFVGAVQQWRVGNQLPISEE